MILLFWVVTIGLIIRFSKKKKKNDLRSEQNINYINQVNNQNIVIQPYNNNYNFNNVEMVYYANDPNNLPDNEYRFSYAHSDSGWRAYILRSPSYNGRSATFHRLISVDGRFYICWDTSITTLREMQNVARKWADLNQRYIATGEGF